MLKFLSPLYFALQKHFARLPKNTGKLLALLIFMFASYKTYQWVFSPPANMQGGMSGMALPVDAAKVERRALVVIH